jgi:hypothetical protein
MRVVYLANVGTRDVQRQGQALTKPRLDGANLIANYEAVRAELTAPILTTGLRRVLQDTPKISRVQLFVTDQPAPPDTPEFHWQRDTVEFGKLLQRLLREEFSAEQVERIECEPIRVNPSDYNSTLPFYHERLPRLIRADRVDVAYIAPVGGADACNVGLTINAVRLYREKCQFIYVPEGSDVQVLELHKELLGDYARQEAAAHLQRHDYSALRETLRRARIGKEWHEYLCDAAERRLLFDFRGADDALRRALDAADGGDAKVQIQKCRESLRPFLAEQKQPTSASDEDAWQAWFRLQRLLLGELFFNLRLKVQQGAWVDALGRMFRLHEGLLRLVFELETRHSTDGNDREGYPDFAKALQEEPALRALNRDDRPTTYALERIIEYWTGEAGKDAYQPVTAILGVFRDLSGLRNKSIIAHGYEGVSEEEVAKQLKTLKPEQLPGRLAGALKPLGVEVNDAADPYAVVRMMLHNALRVLS